jgi:hypothetical protein
VHTDEDFVFESAGMDYSGVTNGDIVSDDGWVIICQVDDGAILNIGSFTNFD